MNIGTNNRFNGTSNAPVDNENKLAVAQEFHQNASIVCAIGDTDADTLLVNDPRHVLFAYNHDKEKATKLDERANYKIQTRQLKSIINILKTL